MQRRDLLRAFGAATALALLPHESLAAWTRVASGQPVRHGLTERELALVGAIADTLLPRTDTPGATDVGVPAFVDVIVSENYGDSERAAFVAGLAAFDAMVLNTTGSAFADLPADARGRSIATMEAAGERRGEAARAYWRLKGLIVHGYFTSESVMKNVLKVEIMPGSFNGAAPMPQKQAGAGGR